MDAIDIESNDIREESHPEVNVSTPTRASNTEIRVGMEFANVKDVELVYRQYGKERGFGIIRRNSRDNAVHFCCYKEGAARKRKCSSSNDVVVNEGRSRRGKSCKSGCRVCLLIVLNPENNTWHISKFSDMHNHEMLSPSSLKFIKGHKKFGPVARCLSLVFEDQGIPVGRVPDVLYSHPEEAEFTSKDCYNYIRTMRNQILDAGDAQSVYEYCSDQKELNPGFQFSIQTDEYDRMRNFFGVDARSRVAYELFGETVSFDTTYRKNKYKMPFAPFVGIDHHMHTILFGCALLQDETEDTFVWLFEAWLNAMNGRQPAGFITDQNMAIMNAAAKVFPLSRHRLCVWHINKKFPEKISHLYHDKSKFKVLLNACIYGSNTIAHFEEEWERLVHDYHLEDHSWFTHLYSIRHFWVPVFSKNMFFGGMNTTGRSESINAFFNRFVNSGTTLKQFVNKYGQAIDRRYETFRRSEFDSRQKMPTLTLGMGLEEHAANIYTSEIFNLFDLELRKILTYIKELVFECNTSRTYRISDRLNRGHSVLVYYDVLSLDSKCECQMFEWKGILCGHICAVLFENNVGKIPPQYILQRWTKDVGRVLWSHPVARPTVNPRNIRSVAYKECFDDLSYMGDTSEVVHEFIVKELQALNLAAKAKLDGLPSSDFVGSSNRPEDPPITEPEPRIVVADPHITQTKGRKKTPRNSSTRIRSGIELAAENRVRCSICLSNGHNRRTCPRARVNDV